jgi:hypothetical protein
MPGFVSGSASIEKMPERPECPFNCSPLAYRIKESILGLDWYLSSKCQETSILDQRTGAQTERVVAVSRVVE